MKNILFLYVITLLTCLLSCKKENESDATDVRSLTGIKDSLKFLSFKYQGDKITDANANYYKNSSTNNFDYANFEYSGTNHIKVSSSNYNINIEYLLNDSKLPLKMTTHLKETDNTQYNSTVVFFYKPGTTLLDSAKGYELEPINSYIDFTFEYEGNNISRVIRNRGLISDTFSYAYNTTPNAFRNSDPLLYVYSNLWEVNLLSRSYGGGYTYCNRLFFFPKVFSESTLNTFSYTSGGGIINGKLNYILSNDNKVLQEWYEGYGKEYLYK